MFIIQNKDGKFFAGETMDEEGHISAVWAKQQNEDAVKQFARKDAAESAAEFFGGVVIQEKN